jgi:D-glycero-D-manno-heptose 1,7-bisphosphate phosphatase
MFPQKPLLSRFGVAKRAVFLDQEGVLYELVENSYQFNRLSLFPKAAQAIRRLNEANLFCCLISHQFGAARGEYTISEIEAFNKRLRRLLKKEAKAKLDAVYYCPYLSPTEGAIDPKLTRWSTWRKPNTGMLITAAWEHDLELKGSFMIGDEATDIDLAHNAGLKGILVQTVRGTQVLSGQYQHRTRPDHIAIDLADAVDWLLSKM